MNNILILNLTKDLWVNSKSRARLPLPVFIITWKTWKALDTFLHRGYYETTFLPTSTALT